MPTHADRVAETSTTTGTGTYDLGGAVDGYRTFIDGVTSGDTVHYVATMGNDYEVGEGVITDAAPDTLTRTTIFASSNTDAAVNWGAGDKTIALTLAADSLTRFEAGSVAYLSDTQVAGTNGGTFTSGAWRTRVLNTKDSDPDGIVERSGNQFTLQAGTYLIEASAPGHACGYHSARIQNITDTATELVGDTEYSDPPNSASVRAHVSGEITITAAKTFELQHRCGTTYATFGLGPGAGNTWQSCVFAKVKITKVSA